MSLGGIIEAEPQKLSFASRCGQPVLPTSGSCDLHRGRLSRAAPSVPILLGRKAWRAMSNERSAAQGHRPPRVYGVLREHTPKAICDDCVAKETNVGRTSVNPWTEILGLTTDFDKKHGKCSICQAEKLVTRSLRYA
jgi:hypothetical protein